MSFPPRGEQLLPGLSPREGEAPRGADGPFRGGGRRVLAVRLRPGRRAAPRRAPAADPFSRLPAQVLPLGRGRDRPRRAHGVARPCPPRLLRALGLRPPDARTFLGPELVSEGRRAILSGPPGRGKTHLGVAIAYRALQNGFEVRFTTADELIGELSLAAQGSRLEEALEPYVHPHVLVIDELGYQSYAADAANVLFRVVSTRHLEHRPTIVTTNKPLAALGQVLHDADLAGAILDRLLERGTHYVLRGRSYRTRHHGEEVNPSDEEAA